MELPSKWPTGKKWSVLTIASLVCFVVGINSTAVLSAVEEISNEFHVDLDAFDYSFFLVTAWNAGAAFVPLFLLPVMEDFGVRPIYITIYVLFVIFVMVQAVAPNFATLIVSRVVAGSCGGALQNAIDGMAADLWIDDPMNLARSMTIFIFALLGGVTIGPAIGGSIIKSLGWRWIFYVQLIIYVTVFPFIVFLLHETRTKKKESKYKETIFRSSRMLCTEFVLSSFTLWSSFAFGTVFLLTQSIPLVYATLYEWPEWKSGIIQLAIFLGEIIGVLLCVLQDSVVYPRFSSAEARLYTAIPASFLGLAAGFFIYVWTSSPSDQCPWPLPTLGLLLIGTGIMVVVQAVSTYITEFYGPLANSAVSAVAFGENCFAAFLPLATRNLYQTLGYPWASSLLGFLALVVSMAPVVLVIFGARIRARDQPRS